MTWDPPFTEPVVATLTDEGSPADLQERRFLTSLASTRAVMALVMVAVTGIMPAVAADLDGEALYGASFSALGLAMVAAIVVAGHLAATRPVDRLLLAGLLTVAAGAVVIACSPTMPTVLVGRTLQGLGLGLVTVLVWAGLGAGIPAPRRAHAGYVLSLAWALATVAGPTIAGITADRLSWRVVFAAIAPVALAVAWFAGPAMRVLTGRLQSDRTAPIAPAVVLAGGLAAVVTGLGQPRASIVAALLLAVGAGASAWALTRVLPAGTLRLERGVPAAVGAAFLAGFAMFGTQAFLPLALGEVHHASATVIGVAVSTSPVTWVFGSAVHTRLAPRWSAAATLRLGAGTLAAAIAAMQLVLVASIPLVVGFLAWAVAGFGMGMTYNTVSVAALAASDRRAHASIAASLQLADAVAITIAAGLSGALVTWGAEGGRSVAGSLRLAWTLAAVAAIGAATLAVRLPRPEDRWT